MSRSKASEFIFQRAHGVNPQRDWISGRNTNLILILIILSIGLSLRLFHLTSHGFWIDESVTHIASRRDFAGLIDYVLTVDGNPPAYLMFMWQWVRAFGFDEAPLRIPSLIFGIVAIAVIYATACRLYNRNVAILSALILSFSSFHVWYAQEARNYTMMVMFTALSFYFLVRLREQNTWRIVCGYLLSSTLMLYTHYFAVFFLLAQNMFVFSISAAKQAPRVFTLERFQGKWEPVSRPETRQINNLEQSSDSFEFGTALGTWIILQASIAISFLPWLPFFLQQMEKNHGDWIEAPSWASLYELFSGFSGSGLVLAFYSLILAGGVALFFYQQKKVPDEQRAAGKRSSSPEIILLVLWFVVPVLAPLILSFVWRPILYPRYVIGASLPFYMLVSLSVVYLSRSQMVRVLLCLGVVLGGTQQMYGYYQHEWNHWRLPNDWRRDSGPAVILVFGEIPKSDLVICPGGCGPFAAKFLGDISGHVAEPKPLLEEANSLYRRENDFKKLLTSRDKVWLVEEYRRDREKRAQAILEENFELVDYFEFWPDRIFGYQRKARKNGSSSFPN